MCKYEAHQYLDIDDYWLCRSDAVRISKEQERDERKRTAVEKKKKEEERKILNEIKSKGIKVEKIKGRLIILILLKKKIIVIKSFSILNIFFRKWIKFGGFWALSSSCNP